MAMSFNFVGKKLLVTGAGRGIGRGIAERFSEYGGTVYALSRSIEPLESLKSSHDRIIPIQANVENWEEVREKLNDIETLDYLVNNAYSAVLALPPALKYTKEDVMSCVKGNILGPINITQIVGEKMVEAKKGSIVNISSIVAIQAVQGAMAYNVTKAGLDMITKQFALEFGPYNIRVNSVNPTLTMTDMVKSMVEKGTITTDMFTSKSPLGRVATVDDIVNQVLYLLSDASAMVSGTINVVDGATLSSFVTDIKH